MGISGAKPSIEKALAERPTFVPTGEVDSIPRPAELTERAIPIWDVLLDDLLHMGVFKPADALILVEVCEMLAEAKRVRRMLDNPPKGWLRFEKDMSEDERDSLEADADALAQLWPMSGAYKRLRATYIQTMRMLKSYIDEFGVTPVARLRLGLLHLQGKGLSEMFGASDDESDVQPAAITGEFREG